MLWKSGRPLTGLATWHGYRLFLSFVVVGLFRSEFNREVYLESFPGARDLNLF